MQQAVMIVMAAATLAAGFDRLIGNKMGLGDKAEEAFALLGPCTASMAGILCMAPVLSLLLGKVIPPLYHALGFDPAMAGVIIAIDMGGYDIAAGLCDSTPIACFAGVVAASMLGCVISFNIPVGMSLVADKDSFAKGTLLGIVVMPIGILIGGLAGGLPIGTVLWQMLPIIVFAAIICLGLKLCPKVSLKVFNVFAWLLRAIGIVGITIGAFEYISGYTVLSSMMPMNEVLIICGSVCIMLLGSLPLAEILRRLLSRPLAALGRRTGMNEHSVNGLLMIPVTLIAALADMKNMDERGRVINSAFSVCATSAVAAQLAFATSRAPEWVVPMLAGKFSGGIIAVLFALWITGRESKKVK